MDKTCPDYLKNVISWFFIFSRFSMLFLTYSTLIASSSFYLYWSNQWRVPETNLHIVESEPAAISYLKPK